MTVPLYAFKSASGGPAYYVMDTHKRVRVTSESERVQMGIAAADIHVLDASNFLWTLPVANP